MTVTVANVPYSTISIGENEAGQLVEDKFNSAQLYADDAITTAQYYLGTLGNLFSTIEVPETDISYDFQEASLETTFDVERPEAPVVEETALESILQPIRPNFEVIRVPTISIPNYNIHSPNTDFNYDETEYESELNTLLISTITEYIENGGTGLGADVEAALWSRAQDRTELENERLYSEVENFYAAKGHEIPSGMLGGRVLEITKEINRNNQQLNYEISIEQARLAKEHTQFNITAGISLEGQEKELFNATALRLLEAAKTAADIILKTFTTKVQGFVSEVQATALEIEAEKMQIDSVIANNANLATIYTTDIEAYKTNVAAELGIIESIAKVYSYKIAGYEADAKVFAIKLDKQIEEYKAKITQANNQTTLSLKEAELTLQGYLGAMNLTVEGEKALSNISAQLAASALSSVNASASLGDSLSRGISSQYSHNNSLSNSSHLSESHSYPHKET